jgi:acyl-CoA synthetase (AMP-forming)/AMP-acid ligase II
MLIGHRALAPGQGSAEGASVLRHICRALLKLCAEARKRGKGRWSVAIQPTPGGLRVADLVLVAQGSIPITTSGKVRRSACVERCLNCEFTRLDVPA